jgi:hypothetical protein
MRQARWLAGLVFGLAACSSGPATATPPPNFPDLGTFTAVDPNDPRLTSTSFVTPDQISCVLDFGPQESIVCSGNVEGLPDSVTGSGCPAIRRTGDAPYEFERSGPVCVPDRSMPLAAGKKFVGKNGTCAVGDGGLVACIDADYRHGFVLQPSGSWAF